MNMLDKLDTLLYERGLNKHLLAEQSGLPYSTIVGIYRKDYTKIKLPTLRALADFFEVSIDFLARDELDVTQRRSGPSE